MVVHVMSVGTGRAGGGKGGGVVPQLFCRVRHYYQARSIREGPASRYSMKYQKCHPPHPHIFGSI